jgi:chromatin modification-related protein YNG2
MDNLSNQKIELAGRLTQLLTRTQARLDADVTKIRILQGEPALQGFSGSLSANVATQISENLRSALDGTSTLTDQITIALAPPTAGTASSSQSNKSRLLGSFISSTVD